MIGRLLVTLWLRLVQQRGSRRVPAVTGFF